MNKYYVCTKVLLITYVGIAKLSCMYTLAYYHWKYYDFKTNNQCNIVSNLHNTILITTELIIECIVYMFTKLIKAATCILF